MNAKKLDFSILVIGRRNFKRKSRGIENFILEASRNANEVMYSSSEKEKYEIEINNAIYYTLNKTPKILAPISQIIVQKMASAKLAKRLTQLIYLSFNPKLFVKAASILLLKKSPLEHLEALVKNMECDRVIIVSHSAGGILAAQTEHLEKIVACICFGYPFKHPEKGEESCRTAPLHQIKKPFLIIQGSDDEYGSALKANDYLVSTSVKCIPVNSNHDYEDIQDSDLKKILDELSDLLTLKASN